jgi:3D (Asp-Asp-Asp) domain-containing protein
MNRAVVKSLAVIMVFFILFFSAIMVILSIPTAQAATRKVTVSAYTSSPEETDSDGCEAASGVDICWLDNAPQVMALLQSQFICASNDYPMGSRLLIERKGVCIVLDRMNKRYTGTGRVDLYFGDGSTDKFAAKIWGVPKLSVIKL